MSSWLKRIATAGFRSSNFDLVPCLTPDCHEPDLNEFALREEDLEVDCDRELSFAGVQSAEYDVHESSEVAPESNSCLNLAWRNSSIPAVDCRSTDGVIKTAVFTDFLNYFSAIAKGSGSIIGCDVKRMPLAMFKKVFPGQAESSDFILKGYFYCIVHYKHEIACFKAEGVVGNPRSPCEGTVPFRFDTTQLEYID